MKKLKNNQTFERGTEQLVSRPGRNVSGMFLAQSIKRALDRGQVATPPKGVADIPTRPMPWWQAKLLLWGSAQLPFYWFFEIQTLPGTFAFGKARKPIFWINARRRLAETGWAYSETHVLHKSTDKIKANRTAEIAAMLKQFEKRARSAYFDYIARRVFSSL